MRSTFLILAMIFISLNVICPFAGYTQGEPKLNSQTGHSVKGKVVDENGAPLLGVSISVKGSDVTTVTDASGNYSLKVAGSQTILVFSFVGLTAQEIKVGNQTSINLQLLSNKEQLQDVVVTALNMKRNPRSLGYSVTQLEGSKVNTVQTPNIVNALSGKIAGVDVGNIANGVAGTKRIVIRGQSSLTGNNGPLWVVDGITINTTTLGTPDASGGADYGDGLNGINPDDIESISVLKGNAAAALYGSRASGGVILITTKSGKSGTGKMRVDISSSLLLDKLIDRSQFQNIYGQSSINQLNSTDLPTSAANAMGSDSWGHKMDGTPAVQFDGVIRPFSPVKDVYSRFFNMGSTVTNTVALSGSNQTQDYRISLSDLRNKDIVPNSGYTRTIINTKAHSKFGKLDVDVVLNYIFEQANNRPFIGGNHDNQFYSLLYLPNSIDLPALQPGFDSTGREKLYTAGVSNPYYIANKEKEVDTKNRLIGSLSLKYDFTKWLYMRGRMTRDFYLAKRLQYIPDNNLSSSFPYSSPSNIGGTFDQRSKDNVENNYEGIIGIAPKLKGKFQVNGFVGGNINWRASTTLIDDGNTFVVPGVYTFNNLKNKTGASTGDSKQQTNSLFASAELSYNKDLYLTLTARNDWFSSLPPANDNLLYPSAALSFIFSDAFKLPSFISLGKFRASSAQVSGDTGPYQLDLSYSLDPTIYNGTVPLQLISNSNIPNNKLKPLLSTDYEFGLNMDFLKGRIGFDAGYYNKSTVNDIVTTAVSSPTGYSTAVLNVGQLKNSGIEILLKASPFSMKNFSWDMTFTYSHNNNRVISLGTGAKNAPILMAVSKSGNAFVQLTEGQRYGGIYGFTYTKYTKDNSGNKVYDANGFPVVNSTASFLGNSTYDQLFGFSNTFRYKNFSLYCFIEAKFGAQFYSETNATAYKNGKHMATLVGRDTGLLAAGVNQAGTANTVRVSSANLSNYYIQMGNISQQFIYDGSFVKMREIALGYKLPQKLITRIGFTNATVSLVARNLFTIYKDKNLENVDPESSVSSGNAQGIERMVYPTTTSYGITIKFGL